MRDEYPLLANDRPVPASHRMADSFKLLLPTFDFSLVMAYDPRVLAYWPAQIYDIPMADASLEARSQVFADFKEHVPEELSVLYDLTLSSAGMAVESFKLVLVPVWMAEIPVGLTTHHLLVNGQNGKISAGA